MDRDPFGHGLDNAALLFWKKIAPAGVEVLGFPDDLVRGGEADPQEVEFALEVGDLVAERSVPLL